MELGGGDVAFRLAENGTQGTGVEFGVVGHGEGLAFTLWPDTSQLDVAPLFGR